MSAPQTRIAPWEDFVLRLIAFYKMLHALFFIGVGFGLLRLRGHNVVDFLNAHLIIPYHLNPENQLIYWILDQADDLTSHRLLLLGYAAFFYAALFAAEAVGLYLRKHWAEYLVVIVTGSLLPLEIYELWIGLAWWKFAAVVGNLAIVSYLIHRILLDGRFKQQRIERDAQAKGQSLSVPESLGHDGNGSASTSKARPITSKVP